MFYFSCSCYSSRFCRQKRIPGLMNAIHSTRRMNPYPWTHSIFVLCEWRLYVFCEAGTKFLFCCSYASSVLCLCAPLPKLLNIRTSLHAYRGIRAYLNGGLHKFLPSVSVSMCCVLSLLRNGSVHCISSVISNDSVKAAGMNTQITILFVIPFYLQSVAVHSANCVKNTYNGI
jgi:hypothetical protein